MGHMFSGGYHNKNKQKEVLMKIGWEVQMTGIRHIRQNVVCVYFVIHRRRISMQN